MKKLKAGITWMWMIFLLAGCDINIFDEPKLTELEKLPAITATGANTVGCLVNGKALIPYPYVLSHFNVQPDVFDIILKNDKIHSSLSLYVWHSLRDITTKMKYPADSTSAFAIVLGTLSTRNLMKASYCVKGYVKFSRLDTINHIASGIFEYDIAAPGDRDTLKVRAGRFDVLYMTN